MISHIKFNTFASGNKIKVDLNQPESFESPVDAGSGLKYKITNRSINKSPSTVRIIMVIIFIILGFRVKNLKYFMRYRSFILMVYSYLITA
jgi:hypothetical protein